MVAFIYRCPYTSLRVQGFSASDVPDDTEQRYESVTCLACRQVHLVNPRTGKLIGEDDT